jgi:acetyl-CoA carboxylase biotin carboxyl carrier protein
LAHEHLTYDDLLRIVELIKSSERFSEFRLKVGEIEIELRRRSAVSASNPAPVVAAARVEPTPDASQIERDQPYTAPHISATWPEGSIIVRSPMVGTFYRAPEPGAPPFVRVGEAVEPGTTVCIVEVMKLMNSIPAGAHGTVMQVLVDDASPVEAGQPLIALQPGNESR